MAKQFKEPVVDFGFRHPDENTPPAEPAAAAPPPTPVSDAFRAKAEQWKRDLLDVTRRNRAINYRSAKSSLSLPADPEELFERLVATDGETAFTARNYAPDAAVPVDDERAVAAFDAASRLADRARLADREQGIQVLFLALAWLNWSDNEGHELRSPLLLAPVDLTFDRQDKQIVVQAAADDAAEVNPSLAYLLASQYGLRLPQIEDAEGDPTFPTLAAFVEKVAETVANQPSWSVEVDGPIVDVFAFAKLAMVDEIERRLADFAQHPILRGLAGDGALPEPPETTDGPLDARYAPGKLRLVVDADAYQLQAVALAATGRSFVIEGPPGTGKSQTITNIISELMAQGKRVLFVAEKRVAREVVLDNLRSAGLAEAALHLASNAGATSRADAKAQVIKEIVDTLDAGPPPPPPDAALPTRYGALRQRLNAYSDAISRPLGDGGWTTTFDVLGAALTQSSDFRDGIAIPPIAGKARYWLDDVADAAKALDDFPPDAVALLATPWAELKWTSAAGGEEQRLRSALETLAHLEVGAAELIGPALGPSQPVPGDHSIEQIEAIRQGFVDVADYRRKASSILRFVNPAFYSAKGKYKKFLTAGYRETGVEATAAESVRALIEQARAALATCSDAFGAATPASAGATQISAWAKGLMAGLGQFEEVVQMAAVLGGLSSLEMREPFIQLLADTSTHRRMATVVPATVYGVWARQLSQGDLATTPEQHARLVDSFARLDGEMIGWGRAAVLSTVRDKRPRSVNHSAMAPLVKYARAKRRPALRTMLGNSREAVQLLNRYDRTALPVVDSRGVLLGIVTHDDLADVAQQEATEEMQRVGGTAALEEPFDKATVSDLLKKRAPWLALLFLSELLTSNTLQFFDDEIKKAAVLAAFIPAIISSGGNSGSQASTLVIRALSLGEIKLSDWWRVLRRELLVAGGLGLMIGLIGLFRVNLWGWLGWWVEDKLDPVTHQKIIDAATGKPVPDFTVQHHFTLLSVAISISLFGIVLWGSIMGAMLPFVLKKCKFDPAGSSTPFVATLVDVTGIIIYFTCAMVVLKGTLL